MLLLLFTCNFDGICWPIRHVIISKEVSSRGSNFFMMDLGSLGVILQESNVNRCRSHTRMRVGKKQNGGQTKFSNENKKHPT